MLVDVLRKLSDLSLSDAASRILFQTVLDSVQTGVAVYLPLDGGEDYIHAYVNTAYQSLKPFPPMAGRRYSKVWPELATQSIPRLRRVLETGEPWVAHDQPISVEEVEGEGTEKRYFTREVSRLATEEEAYLLDVWTDVTREVEAREAMEGTHERFRLATSAPDLVLAETDRRLRYIWMHNPHPDFDPVTVIGKRDDELDSSPDVWNLLQLKRRVLETGDSAHEEWSVVRSDGRHYYDLFLNPRRNEAGEVLGVVTAAIDITARRRAQKQLLGALNRSRFLSQIIETSSQPFAYGLSEGRLLLVNPAFEKLTGYSQSELYSMESAWIDVLTPPEWCELEAEWLERLHESGQPQRYEKEYVRKDGRRINVELLTHLAQDDYNGQETYYSFVTDITERKRAEDERLEILRSRQEKDRAIRQAYNDVIDAVTGGRLVILGRDEIACVVSAEAGDVFEIREPSELSQARRTVAEILGDTDGTDDLLLAFSEGVTNMIKHAGGGTYRVCADGQHVWIVLEDRGNGIDFRHLPKATLMAGFSTAQTLGMGFTLMMELTTRLLLCSDRDGTVLVLESDRQPALEES